MAEKEPSKSLIKRMGHVALQVEDLDRALHFYREILNLDSKWIGDDDWAQVSIGKDDLSLVRKSGAIHPPHLGFRVGTREDLVKLYERLEVAKLNPDPIKVHRDATESFYFRDPDGNWLEALWDPSEKTE